MKISTREALIQAATDVFSTYGFEALTFDKIAKIVGISQPAVYRHFHNKEELLGECCLFAAQEGRDIIDRYIDTYAPSKIQLDGYVEGNLRWIVRHKKKAYSIVSLYYFSHTNNQLRTIYDSIESAGVQRIAKLLSQGNHERAWSIVDIETTARSLRNYLVGELLYAFHSLNRFAPEYLSLIQENMQKMIKFK